MTTLISMWISAPYPRTENTGGEQTWVQVAADGSSVAMGWESKISWTLSSATVPGSSSFQHLAVNVLFVQAESSSSLCPRTLGNPNPMSAGPLGNPSYFVVLQAWQDVDVP